MKRSSGPRRLRLALLLACATVAMAATSVCEPVTIHLAGDSTMAEKLPEKRPETGWGEMLARHFTAESVRVANHARNGRSTRTFIEEGRWAALIDSLRPGDYVLIQFGHNDASREKEDRYTSPADYRRNLERFVDDVEARGGRAVLLTPVARRRFDAGGAFYDGHGEYPGIVREVAAARGVPLIDMHRSSGELLRALGEQRSRALFLHLAPAESPNYPEGLRDDTHFSPLGAACMAELAVEGIVELRLPLAERLRPDGPAACGTGEPITRAEKR